MAVVRCPRRSHCPRHSRYRPCPAAPAAADGGNTASAAAVGVVIVAAAVVFAAAVVVVAAAVVLVCPCSRYLVVLVWVCLCSFGFCAHSFGLVRARPCSFMPLVVSVSNIRSVYTK